MSARDSRHTTQLTLKLWKGCVREAPLPDALEADDSDAYRAASNPPRA
jgi:hypothetical protein